MSFLSNVTTNLDRELRKNFRPWIVWGTFNKVIPLCAIDSEVSMLYGIHHLQTTPTHNTLIESVI